MHIRVKQSCGLHSMQMREYQSVYFFLGKFELECGSFQIVLPTCSWGGAGGGGVSPPSPGWACASWPRATVRRKKAFKSLSGILTNWRLRCHCCNGSRLWFRDLSTLNALLNRKVLNAPVATTLLKCKSGLTQLSCVTYVWLNLWTNLYQSSTLTPNHTF